MTSTTSTSTPAMTPINGGSRTPRDGAARRDDAPVVVIVSGDFTTTGGMDRANYELAWHLAEGLGANVHLVAYRVAPPLSDHSNVTWHRVNKVLNSYTLAEQSLRRRGRAVAASLPVCRVIVNGGNCDWPDVNWIHALHAAWPRRDRHAPLSFRARAAWTKWRARTNERRAVRRARVVLTNSQRTRRQICELLDVAPDRVHAVYYGVDADVYRPPTPVDGQAGRAALGLPPDVPVVGFIGTLGWDRNKGFDTLFRAQQLLCTDPNWTAVLVAAGGGQEVDVWRREAARHGLAQRVRMLGFTDQIPQLLAAVDLLVAPSQYESYGLAVHEALCRGIPVMASEVAGVAERYPAALSDLLIRDPLDAAALAAQLRRWHATQAQCRVLTAEFGDMLRQRSWADMSNDIVNVIGLRVPATTGGD
jgi:glycosyltransferase involved in cell wall biosynthesis